MQLYKSLWKIEEVFRINKHTLKMRPIYHRIPKRIKAHIMICFLAYTILRHTEITLQKAGLSFSPQEIIDTLKDVESFLIKDQIQKNKPANYCIPKILTKSAQKIYSALKKPFPSRPYLIT